MAARFKAPRGTQDILPSETWLWQRLEAAFREVCRRYGYREIRTPIFEETEVFARGAGEGTELVSKQMYTFSKDSRYSRLFLKSRTLEATP